LLSIIELDGEDLRRSAIEYRKLAKLVRNPRPGIVLNEHYEGDGDILFEHACKLGCEGIVSKRLGLTLSLRALAALAQDQKFEGTSGETRGRGRLGFSALDNGQKRNAPTVKRRHAGATLEVRYIAH
jgi:hypothetical protein